MWYHPETFVLRLKDVLAAWLFCAAMVACGLLGQVVPSLYEAFSLDW
jgi:hypothetical protein